MEVIDCAPTVSRHGLTVIFTLSIRGREVEGVIAHDALEICFWLPRGADEMRTLKTFETGRQRIMAVPQRKLLARPDGRLSLTVHDFVAR